MADLRVIPEPRCHITLTRRTTARSSHPGTAATPDLALSPNVTHHKIRARARQPGHNQSLVTPLMSDPACPPSASPPCPSWASGNTIEIHDQPGASTAVVSTVLARSAGWQWGCGRWCRVPMPATVCLKLDISIALDRLAGASAPTILPCFVPAAREESRVWCAAGTHRIDPARRGA